MKVLHYQKNSMVIKVIAPSQPLGLKADIHSKANKAPSYVLQNT
jgi:hypothetical protein